MAGEEQSDWSLVPHMAVLQLEPPHVEAGERARTRCRATPGIESPE